MSEMPGTLCKRVEIIDDALAQLEMVGVPKYLLEEWRLPLIRSLRFRVSRWGGIPRRCYLGFYGQGRTAEFLKIGIAKEPKKRLAGIDTSTPHKRLWSFQTDVGLTDQATEIESTLLNHFGERRASGEWVRLDAVDEQGACEVAARLSKIATVQMDYPVTFNQIAR